MGARAAYASSLQAHARRYTLWIRFSLGRESHSRLGFGLLQIHSLTFPPLDNLWPAATAWSASASLRLASARRYTL